MTCKPSLSWRWIKKKTVLLTGFIIVAMLFVVYWYFLDMYFVFYFHICRYVDGCVCSYCEYVNNHTEPELFKWIKNKWFFFPCIFFFKSISRLLCYVGFFYTWFWKQFHGICYLKACPFHPFHVHVMLCILTGSLHQIQDYDYATIAAVFSVQFVGCSPSWDTTGVRGQFQQLVRFVCVQR